MEQLHPHRNFGIGTSIGEAIDAYGARWRELIPLGLGVGLVLAMIEVAAGAAATSIVDVDAIGQAANEGASLRDALPPRDDLQRLALLGAAYVFASNVVTIAGSGLLGLPVWRWLRAQEDLAATQEARAPDATTVTEGDLPNPPAVQEYPEGDTYAEGAPGGAVSGAARGRDTAPGVERDPFTGSYASQRAEARLGDELRGVLPAVLAVGALITIVLVAIWAVPALLFVRVFTAGAPAGPAAVATLAAIAIGIYAWTRLSLAPYAAVAERRGARDSLSYSWAVARGRVLKLALLGLVAMVIVVIPLVVVGAVIEAALEGRVATAAASTITNGLVLPFIAAAFASALHQLTRRPGA